MSVKINWGKGEVDVSGQVSIDDMPKIHALIESVANVENEEALLVISDMFGMDMPEVYPSTDHQTEAVDPHQ